MEELEIRKIMKMVKPGEPFFITYFSPLMTSAPFKKENPGMTVSKCTGVNTVSGLRYSDLEVVKKARMAGGEEAASSVIDAIEDPMYTPDKEQPNFFSWRNGNLYLNLFPIEHWKKSESYYAMFNAAGDCEEIYESPADVQPFLTNSAYKRITGGYNTDAETGEYRAIPIIRKPIDRIYEVMPVTMGESLTEEYSDNKFAIPGLTHKVVCTEDEYKDLVGYTEPEDEDFYAINFINYYYNDKFVLALAVHKDGRTWLVEENTEKTGIPDAKFYKTQARWYSYGLPSDDRFARPFSVVSDKVQKVINNWIKPGWSKAEIRGIPYDDELEARDIPYDEPPKIRRIPSDNKYADRLDKLIAKGIPYDESLNGPADFSAAKAKARKNRAKQKEATTQESCAASTNKHVNTTNPADSKAQIASRKSQTGVTKNLRETWEDDVDTTLDSDNIYRDYTDHSVAGRFAHTSYNRDDAPGNYAIKDKDEIARLRKHNRNIILGNDAERRANPRLKSLFFDANDAEEEFWALVGQGKNTRANLLDLIDELGLDTKDTYFGGAQLVDPADYKILINEYHKRFD